MRKSPNVDRRAGDGANRRRVSDRRHTANRRAADFERRHAETEELARANRRELGLQFTRIAQIQAELDALLKSGRSGPPPPSSLSIREYSENIQSVTERLADRRFAAMPPTPGDDDGRRRS